MAPKKSILKKPKRTEFHPGIDGRVGFRLALAAWESLSVLVDAGVDEAVIRKAGEPLSDAVNYELTIAADAERSRR